jgi:DNA (cytosine-5)-methyltransferase 1
MEISNKINFIEVCAGAGGLSSAFTHKGFKPILLNDNDKYCIDTLKHNHPNTELFHGNMEDIDL